MSRMTSVSGNRLLLLAVGGPAERGQEQKHRLEEHLRTFEAVRDRPPAAGSPGELGPGTRSALRPIAAVAPACHVRALASLWTATQHPLRGHGT